ncbi:DUF3298 domain-containing protein [Christiangramia crocea]|uniref:DUF3298 and DUF4163 domain-containing protein n=1 Tax=Christiangramia crocea TaxID=2904124 RepID=A0A9X1UVL7_9FLAO|nr:DUF3298 and DUF4163 domain-containing protein [Gramella crocea]
MKRILIAFSIISLLASCADEPKENNKETDESLSFSSRTIEKSLDNCTPEEGECTFISLTFPVAEKGEGKVEKINKAIQDFLRNTIDYQEEGGKESPEELVENFIANYKETAMEFPEYNLPWEATINGKIIYRDQNVICLQFNTDMFTGGAHGYRSIDYLNFDPDSGKNLNSGDIFTEKFEAFVEKDFRKKQDIPENSNINSTGMLFENDQFHLPKNIGITEDKVILHYNAYEIAPYASGNFILTYPRAEIEEFIKISGSKTQV